MQGEHDQPGYFIDPELMPEMWRLLKQDQMIFRAMRDQLFAPEIPVGNLKHVLDVACGPGGWALSVAEKYPDIHVTGFDLSERMIEYARVRARKSHLNNAQFYTMNALEVPLQFPDESFDLVNIRFVVGFMPRNHWPSLVEECTRILRPGGILSLTESDTSTIVGGPAHVEIGEVIAQAMWVRKQSFLPNRSIGVTPMLNMFLEEHGYEAIQLVSLPIDCSFGSVAHDEVILDFLSSFELMKPFLLKTGILTVDDFERIYQSAQQEAQQPSFRMVWYILTAYGKKSQ